MAANLGLLRKSFMERSKERLLSRSNYSDLQFDDVTHRRCLPRFLRYLGQRFSSLWDDVKAAAVSAYQMGRSDPRKVIFAAKLGVALSLVSVLVFFKEPSSYISGHSIWAILTVVVVFEFSIGATLNKGFNRALGTLSAGALSLGIADLANRAGDFREVVVVISIFIAGFSTTYLKLYPPLKQYEYGFRVFMLTFCIVLVSGPSSFVQTAISRLLLIAVGAGISLAINICVYPIWSGEDLHKLVVKNFKGVATSLEGCTNMYLDSVNYTRIPSKILIYQASDDPLYKGYRAAVESTSQEDSLLGFAIWEPPHGRYKMFNYPWSDYVRVSGALRHCAFMVMAMHGCILSEIQAPADLRQAFKDKIQRVGVEGAKVLRALGEKVEKMEKLKPGSDLLEEIHDAAEDLQMTVDKKSYLLVDASNWENFNPTTDFRFPDPDKLQELKDSENNHHNSNKQPVAMIKSISDLSSLRSAQTPKNQFVNSNNSNPYPPQNISFNYPLHKSSSVLTSHHGSGEDVLLRQQTMWPSRLSLIGDTTILNEREAKTYESASALSLATYTSLLIEFVARLQNLVDSFVELSEKAKFKEPVDDELAEIKVVGGGFWDRVLRCACCCKG